MDERKKKGTNVLSVKEMRQTDHWFRSKRNFAYKDFTVRHLCVSMRDDNDLGLSQAKEGKGYLRLGRGNGIRVVTTLHTPYFHPVHFPHFPLFLSANHLLPPFDSFLFRAPVWFILPSFKDSTLSLPIIVLRFCTIFALKETVPSLLNVVLLSKERYMGSLLYSFVF